MLTSFQKSFNLYNFHLLYIKKYHNFFHLSTL